MQFVVTTDAEGAAASAKTAVPAWTGSVSASQIVRPEAVATTAVVVAAMAVHVMRLARTGPANSSAVESRNVATMAVERVAVLVLPGLSV